MPVKLVLVTSGCYISIQYNSSFFIECHIEIMSLLMYYITDNVRVKFGLFFV